MSRKNNSDFFLLTIYEEIENEAIFDCHSYRRRPHPGNSIVPFSETQRKLITKTILHQGGAANGVSLESFLGGGVPQLVAALNTAVENLEPTIINLNNALADAPIIGPILTSILQIALDSIVPQLQALLTVVGVTVGQVLAALGRIVDCLIGGLAALTAEISVIEAGSSLTDIASSVVGVVTNPAVSILDIKHLMEL